MRSNGWNRFATLAVLAMVSVLVRCDSASSIDTPDDIAAGTWGGDKVGLIVEAAIAHVHIGCTFGDFPAPILLDDEHRFSVSGDYLLRAYPVAIGPTMPAQFAGVLHGRTLTMTVAVNDTVEKKLVVLGPVTVTLDREPNLGPCPICKKPGERPGTRTAIRSTAASAR
jgi:hypothetical protein